MHDDVKICRQIAKEIVESLADLEDHEELKEKDIQCTTEILLTKTSVPKMVEVLYKIANTKTYHPEFRYGGPASISIQICAWHQQQFLEVVKGVQLFVTTLCDKPVEESND